MSCRRSDTLCIAVVIGLRIAVLVPGLVCLLEIIVINAADVTGFLRGRVGLVPYGVPDLSERARLKGLHVYCLHRGADSMMRGSLGCVGAPSLAVRTPPDSPGSSARA